MDSGLIYENVQSLSTERGAKQIYQNWVGTVCVGSWRSSFSGRVSVINIPFNKH